MSRVWEGEGWNGYFCREWLGWRLVILHRAAGTSRRNQLRNKCQLLLEEGPVRVQRGTVYLGVKETAM